MAGAVAVAAAQFWFPGVCTLQVVVKSASASMCFGVPVPRARRRRIIAFPSGDAELVRLCAGGDDGELGSGVWPVSVDLECCVLGVSRRPMFGSTEISISSEVVSVAALNA